MHPACWVCLTLYEPACGSTYVADKEMCNSLGTDHEWGFWYCLVVRRGSICQWLL